MPHRVRDDLHMGAQSMGEARAAMLRIAELTYTEIGSTRDLVLPTGYRTLQRSSALPPNITFKSARHELLTWKVQRRAGIRVSSTSDVEPDAVVDLRLGIGPLSVTAPCRVVYVIDEPDRYGFAYGTLPGHPESGEEAFVLSRDAEATIAFTVTAFSRPDTALSKFAGPVGHRVQDVMTARYLRAFA
jgi:uncharacterized protein (UPF0548 family)